jgi:hypothetical protein
MGVDLYLNPPQGKCKTCGDYREDVPWSDGEPKYDCTVCYIRRLREGLKVALRELERLRDVHLPMYEGKVGEPDRDVLKQVRMALKRRG